MEEATELSNYLPLSFGAASEESYISFLWDAFQTNYTSEKYEFASLAFHLLYMSFIGFSVWQIRSIRKGDFSRALVGFSSDDENKLLGADSPFQFYAPLKESQIFRFLKLIGCDNAQVGEFAKFVKRRNKIAHPSGTVFFNDKDCYDAEIREVMREVHNIQQHMCPIIEDIYGRFLKESSSVDEREYDDPVSEIQANLLHRYYISQKDIDICLAYDLTTLADEPHYGNMCELHETLQTRYGSEDTCDASRLPVALAMYR